METSGSDVQHYDSPFFSSRATVFHAPQLVANSKGVFPLQSVLLRSAP